MNVEIIRRQDFFVKRGCHPKDSIIIVLEGSFNCTISSSSYQVNKNDVFVFSENSYFKRNVISPIKCIYIQFERFPIALSNGIMKFSDPERIINTIWHLEQAVNQDDYLYIKHFLDDIFMMCTQYKRNKACVNDEIVSKCIKFIDENFENSITLDTLSKEVHVSEQWIIKKFKKHTNTTPIEYLKEVRLNYGKKLLMDNTLSITNIAKKCGYENVYYFSNTFKKHIGISPTEYRRSFIL